MIVFEAMPERDCIFMYICTNCELVNVFAWNKTHYIRKEDKFNASKHRKDGQIT